MVEAVPPVDEVYHLRVFPVVDVAFKAVAVAFKQRFEFVTTGALGMAETVTVKTLE